MLISHKYRFIFIKTRKTAGTSIEVDLSKLLGPDDVVTHVQPPEEGHTPRNFMVGKTLLYNHMTARRVRRAIGGEIFDSYLKFCVEREPVDKSLSFFAMRKTRKQTENRPETQDWDSFVSKGNFPLDHKKYTGLWGNLMVDRILRYEALNDDLVTLMAELGVPFDGLTAKAKGDYRKKAEPPTVTRAQREQIYRAFRPSLKHTGYRLD